MATTSVPAAISIHAPRTGSDAVVLFRRCNQRISIHAPRTGSDGRLPNQAGLCAISIHAPRTGSDVIHSTTGGVQMNISIHAPRTGSDKRTSWAGLRTMLFQSTLPARGATGRWRSAIQQSGISIHAPRTGSDAQNLVWKQLYIYFNPRSPHGERLFVLSQLRRLRIFQSTLPARGATLNAFT